MSDSIAKEIVDLAIRMVDKSYSYDDIVDQVLHVYHTRRGDFSGLADAILALTDSSDLLDDDSISYVLRQCDFNQSKLIDVYSDYQNDIVIRQISI